MGHVSLVAVPYAGHRDSVAEAPARWAPGSSAASRDARLSEPDCGLPDEGSWGSETERHAGYGRGTEHHLDGWENGSCCRESRASDPGSLANNRDRDLLGDDSRRVRARFQCDDCPCRCGWIATILEDGSSAHRVRNVPEGEPVAIGRVRHEGERKEGKEKERPTLLLLLLSEKSAKLPKLGPFPCVWYVDGGRPPLEVGCGMGEGDVCGDVTLGLTGLAATPKVEG